MSQSDIIIKTQEMLKEGSFSSNPVLCADYKAKLSGEYSFTAGILEDIETRRPKWWNENRPKFNSDKACDSAWDSTEDGINQIGMKWRIKRIEKLISSMNSLLRLAEGQMKNL